MTLIDPTDLSVQLLPLAQTSLLIRHAQRTVLLKLESAEGHSFDVKDDLPLVIRDAADGPRSWCARHRREHQEHVMLSFFPVDLGHDRAFLKLDHGGHLDGEEIAHGVVITAGHAPIAATWQGRWKDGASIVTADGEVLTWNPAK